MTTSLAAGIASTCVKHTSLDSFEKTQAGLATLRVLLKAVSPTSVNAFFQWMQQLDEQMQLAHLGTRANLGVLWGLLDGVCLPCQGCLIYSYDHAMCINDNSICTTQLQHW